MNPLARKILNALLFYLGWVWCIKDALDHPFPIQGPLVVLGILTLHFILAKDRKHEIRVVLGMALFGTFYDTLYQIAGLVNYRGGYPEVIWLSPLWMTSLWALFGTSLNGSLSWLSFSPWLAALFGAVGGPFCYMVPIKLGVAELLVPEIAFIFLQGACWAIIMPTALYLSEHRKQ